MCEAVDKLNKYWYEVSEDEANGVGWRRDLAKPTTPEDCKRLDGLAEVAPDGKRYVYVQNAYGVITNIPISEWLSHTRMKQEWPDGYSFAHAPASVVNPESIRYHPLQIQYRYDKRTGLVEVFHDEVQGKEVEANVHDFKKDEEDAAHERWIADCRRRGRGELPKLQQQQVVSLALDRAIREMREERAKELAADLERFETVMIRQGNGMANLPLYHKCTSGANK
jgi:hypothetical protein